jgi:uncharacterized protein YjiS (DUF1127 family)
MATILHGMPALNTPQIHTGFRLLAVGVQAWFAERARRASILRELNRLDDRDLRDLGLSSYDFKAIANGSLTR